MATKKSPQSSKKSSRSSAAASRSGPIPPYGVAIREAVARGDEAEMQKVATAARKYLNNLQTALDKLTAATGKKS